MTDYEAIAIKRAVPTVTHAPERTVVSLELLRDMHASFFVEPDLMLVGHFEDGKPCFYRVTGWSAEDKALIVERSDGPSYG